MEGPSQRKNFSRWPSSSDVIFNQAVVEGDVAKVKFLLKYGGRQIAINEKNRYGLTPLQQSCLQGNIGLVMLLLDHGANIEGKDENGWSAIHFAIMAGHCNVTSLLIDACADLTRLDTKGRLPIELAQTEDMLVLIAKAMETAGYEETARLYLENWGLRSQSDEDRLSPMSLSRDTEFSDAHGDKPCSQGFGTNCPKDHIIHDFIDRATRSEPGSTQV